MEEELQRGILICHIDSGLTALSREMVVRELMLNMEHTLLLIQEPNGALVNAEACDELALFGTKPQLCLLRQQFYREKFDLADALKYEAEVLIEEPRPQYNLYKGKLNVVNKTPPRKIHRVRNNC